MKNEPHIQRELAFPEAAQFGKENLAVKRVQEWLTLAGFGLVVDSDFGPATREALQKFQDKRGRPATGVLTAEDWADLSAPLLAACAAPAQVSFLARLRAVAQLHAKARGREVSGPNAGPWVRFYMRGHEGKDQLWCAGFVSFLLRQAALNCTDTAAAAPWQNYHEVSCDQLAKYAKSKSRFLSNSNALDELVTKPGAFGLAMFLLRTSAADWSHTGLALDVRASDGLLFSTVEGNSNEGGSNNGVEVVTRTRAGKAYDLVRLS